MSDDAEVRTAQAGTLESMDCLVTILSTDGPRVIEIAGAGSSRFRGAMERRINEVLDSMGAPPVRVGVQDNGAMDLVLGARVEAAYRRFAGGEAR